MGRIPEQVIDEIRRRVNIADVVGQVVTLQKAGNGYKGKCPFHADKDPSLSVRPEFGTYKCFGCDAKGNVFTFLMEHGGLTFVEAVEELGARVGVEVPKTGGEASGPNKSERQAMIEANREASLFFQDVFWKLDESSYPRTYMREKRALTEETIRRFGIGYAPDSWHALHEHLMRKKIPEPLIAGVGLLSKSEKDGRLFDKFRNRVMCPITDLRGGLIGFSGRTLGDDDAKYMNSPESPVFNKSKSFYALDLARDAIRETKTVIVVEGNFDVVKLHQSGFTNTVAALGTALTPDHARMLTRLAERVILLMDGDAAGRKAAFRAMEIFLVEDYEPEVVILPDGEDPDSFVEHAGKDSLASELAASRPIVERFIDAQVEAAGDSVQGKTRAVTQVAKVLTRTRNPTRRALYTERLASKIGVPVDAIEQALRTSRLDAVRHAPKAWQETVSAPAPRAERLLVLLALRHPSRVMDRIDAKTVDAMRDEPLAKVLTTCRAMWDERDTLDAAAVPDRLDDDRARSVAIDVMMDETALPADAVDDALADCQKRIRTDATKQEKRRLLTSLAEAEKRGDKDNIQILQDQLRELTV